MKLTRHSYTAKAQHKYMTSLKLSMKPNTEIIVQGDLAENFSCIVQDKVQSFCWDNRQATLHPFMAYCQLADETLKHRNVCIISDITEHNTSIVYAFLQIFIDYLKVEFPEVQKVYYFTDGCAGQYKNKSNFINLCSHVEDFGLQAECHFFTTSHGKSACDGIGGTVKHLLTKASLQRPYNDANLTTESIMEFCKENVHRIKFFNVKPDRHEACKEKLKPRFQLAKTIKGTLKFYRFVPISPIPQD